MIENYRGQGFVFGSMNVGCGVFIVIVSIEGNFMVGLYNEITGRVNQKKYTSQIGTAKKIFSKLIEKSIDKVLS